MIGLAGAIAALLAWGLGSLVRRYALAHHIVDDPSIDPTRRLHHEPIPLLGGVAVGTAVLLTVAFVAGVTPLFDGRFLLPEHILGILVGVIIILLGGYLDDRFRLPARLSIIAPVAAAIVAVASGIGVNFITNPFGGVWRIDTWRIVLWASANRDVVFTVGADVFAFVWIMAMMYTTKILDGLDGLVSGLTAIAAGVLIALSLRPPVLQPDTATLSAIVAGAFFGFLIWNWSPARLFLGESGSVLAGFLLAVVSISAGGKIATTLLVMGLPALDLLWVTLRRLWRSPRTITIADRSHLHFQLLDAGMSPRHVVLLFWATAVVFGSIGLTQGSFGKLVLLTALVLCMVAVVAWARRQRTLHHNDVHE